MSRIRNNVFVRCGPVALHPLDCDTEMTTFAGSTSQAAFRGYERYWSFVGFGRNDIPGIGEIKLQGIFHERLAVRAVDVVDVL